MNKNNLDIKRIDTLDSLRFVAILGVILFHYYSRYAPPIYKINLYPYSVLNDVFSLGFLGVQLFFIISGFVIAFTLQKTPSIILFWKKRMIRLYPTLVICSMITYIFCIYMDDSKIFPESQSIINFVYSLTFISPQLLNSIFANVDINISGSYLNGSLWSLWPEIQFYFIASFLYYLSPKKFVRNFFGVSLFGFLFYKGVINIQYGGNVLNIRVASEIVRFLDYWFVQVFNIFHHVLWFLLGVLFFNIYQSETLKASMVLAILIVALLLFSIPNILVIIIFVFFVFGRLASQLTHFDVVNKLGVVSYSIYLIHENIGVLTINKYALMFNDYSWFFPIIVIFGIMIFSILCYKYIEKPIMAFFHSRL